jgi:hypothetical protein
MGHPQLWWLLIAPRRDGSDLYGPEAEERSDQTADLVPPPDLVTQMGSKTWSFYAAFGRLIFVRATESMGLRE